MCWYVIGLVGTEVSVVTQSVWLVRNLECWYVIGLAGTEATAHL